MHDLLLQCHSIKLHNVRKSEARYESLNDDPALIFNLKHPVAAGWQFVRFKISGDQITEPRLYIEVNGEFDHVHSVQLMPKNKSGEYESYFYTPVPVARFRFDPSEKKTNFELASGSIKSLSRFESIAFLVAHGAKMAFFNPKILWTRRKRYLRYLGNPGFLDVNPARHPMPEVGSYERWMNKYDYSTNLHANRLKSEVDALPQKPLISIVMPVYNPVPEHLDEAIKSVQTQIYDNWELCIADDYSTNPLIHKSLRRWSEQDRRIKVQFRKERGHISHCSNSAFELASGDWVGLLDHDDILRENALAEVALELNRHPMAEIIYSDEDKIEENGKTRFNPHFKPDFSRELFRSQNYINHFTVHRSENIRKVGGWRPGFEGSQDYDLNLRIIETVPQENIRHIQKILYHWRAAEGSTATSGSTKSYSHGAGLKALQEHLERTGVNATAVRAPGTSFYRVKLSELDPEPLVSLIIPTRDKFELLSNAVDSIRQKTTYKNYEILIVDNGSTEKEVLEYLSRISRKENVRILRYKKPFNFSAINNFAVKKAKGSIIGLINNDVKVISPDWLTEMVGWALLPDVGCVGAKLYYANNTVQHAGVILGLGGVAGHSHKHFPRNQPGYFYRLKLIQNCSAVTGACLVVKKDVYNEVNGFNEKDLAIAFNDVDFCLKVRAAGYVNVWTPYAELYHLESPSRGLDSTPEKFGRFRKEIDYMKSNWKEALNKDPYYSPHLTTSYENFAIKE